LSPAAAPAAEVREILPPDTALAFEAMHALRGHVQDETELVERIDGLQRAQGYRLAGGFEAHTEQAAAVVGFRVLDMLDSAVIPEREDAHRLYFNAGMRITSYHFGRNL